MPLKSVLFDLDGVLLDTEGIYTDFWNAVDRRFPTGVDGFAHVIKGTTLPSILGTYFPASQHPAIMDMLRQMESDMQYRMFDGAGRLLRELRDAGIPAAIVTSSNRAKMDVVMERLPDLKKYISVLVTDEDVTASKPDPQGYLLAAARLGVSPADCVVVEDSVNGLRAGLAAGARVAGIATTNSRATVEPLAHCVADTIAELTVNKLVQLFT